MMVLGKKPGESLAVLLLECTDRSVVLQREADVVEAFHQALLAESVDRERVGGAVGSGDRLPWQVDAHGRTRGRVQLSAQLAAGVDVEGHRQQAALQRV